MNCSHERILAVLSRRDGRRGGPSSPRRQTALTRKLSPTDRAFNHRPFPFPSYKCPAGTNNGARAHARNVGQQNDVVAALVGRRVARGEEALFGMDMVWGRQAVNEQGIVRVSCAILVRGWKYKIKVRCTAFSAHTIRRPCCLSARYATAATARARLGAWEIISVGGHVRRHEREQVAKWRADSAVANKQASRGEDKDTEQGKEGRRR